MFVSVGQQTEELKWSFKESLLKIFWASLFSHIEIGVLVWFMVLILIVIRYLRTLSCKEWAITLPLGSRYTHSAGFWKQSWTMVAHFQLCNWEVETESLSRVFLQCFIQYRGLVFVGPAALHLKILNLLAIGNILCVCLFFFTRVFLWGDLKFSTNYFKWRLIYCYLLKQLKDASCSGFWFWFVLFCFSF